jgi:hypothetical protein
MGAGVSALRKHVALWTAEATSSDSRYAIKQFPAFSVGAGAAFAIEFNDLISLAPELQYTLYRANGSYIYKTNRTGEDFSNVHKAGVSVHAIELPVLARFNILDAYYVEAGPQVGFNVHSSAYINSEVYEPTDPNVLLFGPALGGGMKFSGDVLLGARGHFGLFDYAKKTKGYPWAVQASLTKFFF